MTLAEWLRDAEVRLVCAGLQDAKLEARVLASHGLGVDRPFIVAHSEQTIDADRLEPLLSRRLKREPLAYIIGTREFYGRPFLVTPAVLIPRQETELLVDETLRRVGMGGSKILDLGTGSGCVGLTLALERPSWEVTISDISASALAVASANARALGASVAAFQSDVFDAFPGERFDAIVSNPPYIAEGSILMPEVGLYEPALALYGGETGYEFYERLADEADRFLATEGIMLLEMGADQSEALSDIFGSSGWRVHAIAPDLSRIPRVLVLSKQDF